MPEGDTVFRTADRLNQAFAGRLLTRTDLRWPGIETTDLTGRGTLGVVSCGKHILHRVDGGWTIHSHLRMEGSWQVGRSGSPLPRRYPEHAIRAVLATAEWTAWGVRLGMLDLVRTEAEATLVGHLGPDVLGPDWDAGRASANLAVDPAPLGAALLDQRNLAGLGTLWVSETLFLERLSPWTTEPAPDVLQRVVARAKRLLDANVRHAVQSSTGDRTPGRETYVHARSGRPCRRCGAIVRVASIGPATRERTMSYCPGCQGGLAPTDDGRPLGPLGSSRRPSGKR